jgi:hypothetical protein
MSKHRPKGIDIDLGEPLPLPYQIKEEEKEREIPSLEPGPVRQRRWRDVSDHEEPPQNTTNVTIPKLLRYLRPRESGEEPLELIRHHIDDIRTIITKHDLNLDTKTLDDFETQLKKDVDIMDELDKLQTLRKETTPGVSYLKITVVALTIIVVMMGSFLMSGLNYDYCYYLC